MSKAAVTAKAKAKPLAKAKAQKKPTKPAKPMKTDPPRKPPSKHAITRSERTNLLGIWIQGNIIGKDQSGKTSDSLAIVASKALGFRVSPNTLARELDRAGILFRRTAADPPKISLNRVDVMRRRQDEMEARLSKLESERKAGAK